MNKKCNNVIFIFIYIVLIPSISIVVHWDDSNFSILWRVYSKHNGRRRVRRLREESKNLVFAVERHTALTRIRRDAVTYGSRSA